MLENISAKFILENFKKAILENEGNEITINVLIALCSNILDCSPDTLVDIIYNTEDVITEDDIEGIYDYFKSMLDEKWAECTLTSDEIEKYQKMLALLKFYK